MSTFAVEAWAVTLALAPWLLLGAAVAGVLHVLVPEGFVHRQLRGPAGVLKAVVLGVPLPLCSCGVIPAGIGLKRDGASDGAAVGFLIATPQTGVDSILVAASFLGWPFALFKVGSALFLGLVGGLLTEAVSSPAASADALPVPDGPPERSLAKAFHHALEIVRSIWRWLVFGILVSAALTALLPEGSLAGFAAYGGVFALAAVLAFSLPLYVCATASVPIAAALVAGGFPTGAALVFLMAGPATNVATIGAVRRAFGGRALVVYLSVIAVGSIALAWAFDFVLVGQLGMAGHAHEHGAGPVAIASGVLLTLLFAWFALDELRDALRAGVRPGDASLELGVRGMTCDGCARGLRSRLAAADGVDRVEVVREPEGLVRVVGRVAPADVREMVRDAGYEPV